MKEIRIKYGRTEDVHYNKTLRVPEEDWDRFKGLSGDALVEECERYVLEGEGEYEASDSSVDGGDGPFHLDSEIRDVEKEETINVSTRYFTTVEAEWELPAPEETDFFDHNKDWEELPEDERREFFASYVPRYPEYEEVKYSINTLESIH
jgi:hypothetical protein